MKTVLQIRLTSEEKAAIRARARSAEMTVTEYVISRCLHYVSQDELVEKLREAAKQTSFSPFDENGMHISDVEFITRRSSNKVCTRCNRIAGRSLPECNVCGEGCT